MREVATVRRVRVLMVTPRFGAANLGGAENLIRELALHAPAGWDVEVATTCAVDHYRWLNVLPPGSGTEDGLPVHRFPVSERDAWQHERLVNHLQVTGELDPARELYLLGSSVWSEGLQRFIEDEGSRFDALVFCPYLFGTTFWGSQVWPHKSVLVPCLHDEPYAHMDAVRRMMSGVAGCIFNSRGEQALAHRLFDVRADGVVGMGFDTLPPARREHLPPAVAALPPQGYFVYMGRQEEGKRVDVAVRYVAEMARTRPDLKLVLVGGGSYRVPAYAEGAVVQAGFVDEASKRAILADAAALVNPSEKESFSIVLMEAWREGTPVLVAAGSEVMADHCADSGGGFTFTGHDDFTARAASLLDDPRLREAMGEAGRRHVAAEWSWDAVTGRFARVLDAIMAAQPVAGAA